MLDERVKKAEEIPQTVISQPRQGMFGHITDTNSHVKTARTSTPPQFVHRGCSLRTQRAHRPSGVLRPRMTLLQRVVAAFLHFAHMVLVVMFDGDVLHAELVVELVGAWDAQSGSGRVGWGERG